MVEEPSALLELKNVSVSFPAGRMSGPAVSEKVGRFHAVRDVSLTLEKGTTLGLVGESGCGKTTLARAVVQLQRIDKGTVVLNGRDLARLSPGELRRIRRSMQMVFQNPFASLNPRMTVFDALAEVFRTAGEKPGAIAGCISGILEQVGLDPAMMKKFPHEFSGGQRQRIAIARALAAAPSLIVADEPVSSLDVSVAAQILNLLRDLRDRLGLTMLFVSHDLSVVRFISHTIAVMYRGRIVENGPASEVFTASRHPYTAMLLQSVPVLPDAPGTMPFFEKAEGYVRCTGLAGGCPYASRCSLVKEQCLVEEPRLTATETGASHRCACFRAGECSR